MLRGKRKPIITAVPNNYCKFVIISNTGEEDGQEATWPLTLKYKIIKGTKTIDKRLCVLPQNLNFSNMDEDPRFDYHNFFFPIKSFKRNDMDMTGTPYEGTKAEHGDNVNNEHISDAFLKFVLICKSIDLTVPLPFKYTPYDSISWSTFDDSNDLIETIEENRYFTKVFSSMNDGQGYWSHTTASIGGEVIQYPSNPPGGDPRYIPFEYIPPILVQPTNGASLLSTKNIIVNTEDSLVWGSRLFTLASLPWVYAEGKKVTMWSRDSSLDTSYYTGPRYYSSAMLYLTPEDYAISNTSVGDDQYPYANRDIGYYKRSYTPAKTWNDYPLPLYKAYWYSLDMEITLDRPVCFGWLNA